MLIHAEEFFRQLPLLQAVMIIQARLGAPADMQCAVYVRFAPFHNAAQLLPVVHIFKFQIFHRRAGNDHTVVAPVFNLIKRAIK